MKRKCNYETDYVSNYVNVNTSLLKYHVIKIRREKTTGTIIFLREVLAHVYLFY